MHTHQATTNGSLLGGGPTWNFVGGYWRSTDWQSRLGIGLIIGISN